MSRYQACNSESKQPSSASMLDTNLWRAKENSKGPRGSPCCTPHSEVILPSGCQSSGYYYYDIILLLLNFFFLFKKNSVHVIHTQTVTPLNYLINNNNNNTYTTHYPPRHNLIAVRRVGAPWPGWLWQWNEPGLYSTGR